jgi:hypothetical protein
MPRFGATFMLIPASGIMQIWGALKSHILDWFQMILLQHSSSLVDLDSSISTSISSYPDVTDRPAVRHDPQKKSRWWKTWYSKFRALSKPKSEAQPIGEFRHA